MKIAHSADTRSLREEKRKSKLSHDDAEAIATAGLGFLAADRPRLERFLALSGLSPATVRVAARAPGFLLGILDHITNDELLLVDFSATIGVDPQVVARAREILGDIQPEPGT